MVMGRAMGAPMVMGKAMGAPMVMGKAMALPMVMGKAMALPMVMGKAMALPMVLFYGNGAAQETLTKSVPTDNYGGRQLSKVDVGRYIAQLSPFLSRSENNYSVELLLWMLSTSQHFL